MGGLDPGSPEPGAHLLVDGARRTLRVQRKRTPEEIVRIDVPERDQGISQRHLIAAGAVADRTGNGAGALRPHLHQPALIEPHFAASAGPDLGHVDERQLDRIPGAAQ